MERLKELLSLAEAPNVDLQKVYTTALEFFKKSLGISVPIRLMYFKQKKNVLGGVDIGKALEGKYEILLKSDLSVDMAIKFLLHELTHVKQIASGKLALSKDRKFFLWNKEPFISVRQYKTFATKGAKDPKFRAKYTDIPWEKEAETKMKSYKSFFNSSDFKNLADVNDTLKFIVNNEK